MFRDREGTTPLSSVSMTKVHGFLAIVTRGPALAPVGALKVASSTLYFRCRCQCQCVPVSLSLSLLLSLSFTFFLFFFLSSFQWCLFTGKRFFLINRPKLVSNLGRPQNPNPSRPRPGSSLLKCRGRLNTPKPHRRSRRADARRGWRCRAQRRCWTPEGGDH